MPGARRAIAATATAVRPKNFVNTRLRPQMPLIEDTSLVEHWVLTDHAIERAEERNIGIMEIYSTLAQPTSIRERKTGTADYLRGDIRVSVNTKEKVIMTVVDQDEDIRTTPRKPLNPLLQRKATTMPRASKAHQDGLDEAWVLVPHSEPDVRVMTVSPALADKMLDTNHSNRKLRPSLVRSYVTEINEGRWQVTHQGAAMDTTASLQDGQHRLSAIKETGIPQKMMIAVGMPVESFAVIDTGLTRRYADTLFISGYSDPFNLGAAARLVWLYVNRDFTSTYKVSNQQVLELVNRDTDGFTISMHYGGRLNYGAFMTKSAGAAGHYLVQRVNAKTPVNEFFEGLVEGSGLPGGDPRLVLRRLLANQYRDAGRRFGPEQLAWLIKCWNAWVEGREIRNISWKKTEPMPQVGRYERKR